MSTPCENNKSVEIKQAFLSSAIADIATYIQLADTKVSIIMGSLVALGAGIMSCYQPINDAFAKIPPCSWSGVGLLILLVLLTLSVCGVFIFGILTICGHVSIIDNKSKWFIATSRSKYSFDAYKKDVVDMTDEDIIDNMAAELYKLNDINRQKAGTCKWTIWLFAVTLVLVLAVAVLLHLAAK
ncbi:MAG: hypothetical protein IJ418_03070 [Clostridia bacterium]|nr:hypothetical protein [Clostridia bacterium]